ncbi:hypothetical protein MUN81_15310 [Hymenobacter sp. 5317J-9]|uniref:hypothetical protein n=1 Tax=Hymenobacter sp. 5317J-9 TaxID=2932250 RepID=UPI001FD69FF3|nr:hypothetical protein [Hymenobacter sp. 5317J-9]UOQ96603.1 hypothetical protein MUN81_15310 [Hymenobacter sp. 5317J-9]
MAPRFLTLEAVAVVAAGVSGFVDVHIWSPAYSYYSLLVLVVLDVVTNNLVEGKRLMPRNLALRLLAYTVLLAFAHGFAEHEKGLFFLSQLAMAPFVIVHMRRLIISFGKLDLVEPSVADLLQKRISRAAEEPAVPEPEPPVVPAPPAEPVTPA